MSYLDVASAHKDYKQVGFNRSQQRFHYLSNHLDLMTSDLQPMYALTIRTEHLFYYIIIGRLVSTGLYYCFILLSSADCLYIIIFSSIRMDI